MPASSSARAASPRSASSSSDWIVLVSSRRTAASSAYSSRSPIGSRRSTAATVIGSELGEPESQRLAGTDDDALRYRRIPIGQLGIGVCSEPDRAPHGPSSDRGRRSVDRSRAAAAPARRPASRSCRSRTARRGRCDGRSPRRAGRRPRRVRAGARRHRGSRAALRFDPGGARPRRRSPAAPRRRRRAASVPRGSGPRHVRCARRCWLGDPASSSIALPSTGPSCWTSSRESTCPRSARSWSSQDHVPAGLELELVERRLQGETVSVDGAREWENLFLDLAAGRTVGLERVPDRAPAHARQLTSSDAARAGCRTGSRRETRPRRRAGSRRRATPSSRRRRS